MIGAGALGRSRGMGWGGKREGGSGWGTHVNPWLIHVSVWQKPLQYYKVISFQLIKVNGKKKRVKHSDENVPCLKYIHVNALVMILDHSLTRYNHWGKLGKGYTESLLFPTTP